MAFVNVLYYWIYIEVYINKIQKYALKHIILYT